MNDSNIIMYTTEDGLTKIAVIMNVRYSSVWHFIKNVIMKHMNLRLPD